MFDGQSFNFTPQYGIPGFRRTFPYQLVHEMLPHGKFSMHVAGIGGTSYTTRNTIVPTVVDRVDQYLKNAKRVVYLDVSGPSDLLENKTPAQILALAEANADARRAAGASLIITATVTPSTVSYNSAQEANRLVYNNLLRANANRKFDAIADMASLAHAQDSTSTVYYMDGLHPTELLATEIAQLFYDALDRMGVV